MSINCHVQTENEVIVQIINNAVKKKGEFIISDCHSVHIMSFKEKIDVDRLPANINILGYRKGLTKKSDSKKWYLFFTIN